MHTYANTGDCGCADHTNGHSVQGCCVDTRERVRYFPGQMITPEDMIAEQEYHRARARRHNRLLHGWGVVCGADVRREPADPAIVIVEPGFLLGPHGDEILIDTEVVVNVFEEDLAGNSVVCGSTADPWCTSVRQQRPVDDPVYLAVRHTDRATRPVRAAAGSGGGCACSEHCEYSRLRDGYIIKVLNQLPSTYDPMPGHGYPDFNDVITCSGSRGIGHRPCPPCPTQPWVVLAELRITSNAVVQVLPLTHRRFAASFGDYYYVSNPDRSPRDMRMVDVRAPDINRVFDPSGIIEVNDITSPIDLLTGARGSGFLQSRLFPPGLPGTIGAGKFPYQYRVDMTQVTGSLPASAVRTLSLDFGPVTRLNYDGSGDSDIFVTTQGALGTVHPVSVTQAGDRLVIDFGNPGVPSGQTSFFVGLASGHPPRDVTANLTDGAGNEYTIPARAPAFPRA